MMMMMTKKMMMMMMNDGNVCFSAEEIEQFGKSDLLVLSEMLGDKVIIMLMMIVIMMMIIINIMIMINYWIAGVFLW